MTRARRLRLIVDHMPLARKVARQVARKFAPHLAIEDFEQAAYVGLCEAARRCKRVSSFSAFAYFRIRGACVDAHRRKAYREELNPSLEGIVEAIDKRSTSGHDGVIVLAVIDPSPLPDELALAAERHSRLNRAIAELPEDEADVIGQSLAGVGVAAIAESRHRSPTWTRMKLYSARDKVALAVKEKAA